MAILVYQTADGARAEYPIQAVTRIGTGEGNDIRLLDSTAAEHHCEVRLVDGEVQVTDLGSGIGTIIDGERVREGILQNQGVLRIGQVEFILESGLEPQEEIPVPARWPNHLGGSASACRNHPTVLADWRCSKCRIPLCAQCVVDGRKFGVAGVKFCPVCSSKADSVKAEIAARAQAEKGLAAELLGAWKYPFIGDGLMILIAGTVFLAIAAVVQRFAFLAGGLVLVGTSGYMLAYSQKIITSTANGENEPPTWPEFSDFFSGILGPFLQGVAVGVLYFLPYFLLRIFMRDAGLAGIIVPMVYLIVAIFMMPMAWLAVTLHDTVAALSPHLVIPSILRIAGPYLAMAIQLILLVAADVGLGWGLDRMGISVAAGILSSAAGLYFLMVFSRLLGVIYYRNKDELQWF